MESGRNCITRKLCFILTPRTGAMGERTQNTEQGPLQPGTGNAIPLFPPLWSPDHGRKVATSLPTRGGLDNFRQKASHGTGAEEAQKTEPAGGGSRDLSRRRRRHRGGGSVRSARPQLRRAQRPHSPAETAGARDAQASPSTPSWLRDNQP